ncbi:MAG: hypothetical protein KC486_21315, partial [Myxococcales bacterium]|nr:hypothetical protein [Myxococcales bacterium]
MPRTRPDLAACSLNYQRPPAPAEALEIDMAARPRPRRRRGAAIWLLAALGLGLSALSGCASKSEASRAPGAEAGPAYDAGSSIDDLERALADEERRLSAAGVRLPA